MFQTQLHLKTVKQFVFLFLKVTTDTFNNFYFPLIDLYNQQIKLKWSLKQQKTSVHVKMLWAPELNTHLNNQVVTLKHLKISPAALETSEGGRQRGLGQTKPKQE